MWLSILDILNLYPMPLKTATQVSLVISACLKEARKHFFKGSFIMLADLGIFDYFISSLSSRHISIHTKYSKYSKLTLHCGN